MSGRSSRSTLMLTNSSFITARGRARPRSSRAPSRGTSGRPHSRPRAGSACWCAAPRRALRAPMATSRPDCAGAAADTARSRARGGFGAPCLRSSAMRASVVTTRRRSKCAAMARNKQEHRTSGERPHRKEQQIARQHVRRTNAITCENAQLNGMTRMGPRNTVSRIGSTAESLAVERAVPRRRSGPRARTSRATEARSPCRPIFHRALRATPRTGSHRPARTRRCATGRSRSARTRRSTSSDATARATLRIARRSAESLQHNA